MSLILVATVCGVLLERVWLPAGRTRGGTPGRSAGHGRQTVRGPAPPCSTVHDARSWEESCGQLRTAAPPRALGARPGPCGALLGLAADGPGRGAPPSLGARPVL